MKKKILFGLMLLFPVVVFAQKANFQTEIRSDTLVACGVKYQLTTTKRTLQQEKEMIEVSDLKIAVLGAKNAMVSEEKSLSEAEMRQWLQDSEEQNYSEQNYYVRVSETILELVKAKSHTFEGAAHGEHWSESSFLDLKSRSSFQLNDVFTEAAFPVIYEQAWKELQKQNYSAENSTQFPIKRYGFTDENFVISFPYLDADSPIHVSYAQQAVEIEIPFKLLLPFMKEDSPVYKMVTKNSCR